MLFIVIATTQRLVLKYVQASISMFKTRKLLSAQVGDVLEEYMCTMAGHTLEMGRLKPYWD